MTTMDERREMIKQATAEDLMEWFELYSKKYQPLANPKYDKEVADTYKMIKEEILRRLTK